MASLDASLHSVGNGATAADLLDMIATKAADAS